MRISWANAILTEMGVDWELRKLGAPVVCSSTGYARFKIGHDWHVPAKMQLRVTGWWYTYPSEK